MSEKKRSLHLVFYLFYFMVLLNIAACGDDSDPTKTPTTLAPDLFLIVPEPVENPKTNVGIDPALVIGNDNLLQISYYDQTNGDLKFARCTDAACTTPSITIIDATGDVGRSVSMKIATDGFPRMSYYDATNGDLKFALCTDANCTTPTLTTVDAGVDTATLKEDLGADSSLAMASDGFARISYYDTTAGKLKLARCTIIDCSTSILTTVGPATGVGGAHTSMALGLDGFARISHWNLTMSALDYSRCSNADCSTQTTTTVDPADPVDPLGLTGSSASMLIAADGFARITYLGEETTNSVIKYLQCTDDVCTTPNITTIGPALFSISPSIAMAPDGFARISYYDDINGVLKFVRCTDLSCTSPTITTIDDMPASLSPESQSGEYSSLVIGTDGFATIAFFDRTNGDLKLAQCSDADCTTVSIITIDQ